MVTPAVGTSACPGTVSSNDRRGGGGDDLGAVEAGERALDVEPRPPGEVVVATDVPEGDPGRVPEVVELSLR